MVEPVRASDDADEESLQEMLRALGFDDEASLRKLVRLNVYSIHSLAGQPEERLIMAGFPAVHARKLQAIAKRHIGGGGSKSATGSATGSSSRSALSFSSGHIGTSLDRPCSSPSDGLKAGDPMTPETGLSGLEAQHTASIGNSITAVSTEVLLAQSRELALQEKLGEATALCERAVNAMTRTEGGDRQPEAMQAIAMLAELSRRRGRLEEAAQHAAWLLQLKKDTLGEEDLSTADAMFLLGQINKRRGRIEEAVVHLRWALKIRESTLGENHLKTAISLHALGNCFVHQAIVQHEKLQDARASFVRALKIRRQHYGVEHFQTAVSLNNVAVVLFQQRRVQVALDAFVKALEIKIRTVGYDSPSVADSLFNIGSVARDLSTESDECLGRSRSAETRKEYSELAIDCFSRAADISRRALGPLHPNTRCASEQATACVAVLDDKAKKQAACEQYVALTRSGFSRGDGNGGGRRSEARKAGACLATHRKKAPTRKRPETGRSSWDLEDEMTSAFGEEEDIMALVSENDGNEGGGTSLLLLAGQDLSSNPTIIAIEQIIRMAATRPCKNTAAVAPLNLQGRKGGFYHSAEILANEKGEPCLVLASDDGFDDGLLLGV